MAKWGDIGRMAQHFEQLRLERYERPQLRWLVLAGFIGGLTATVLPWAAAVIIAGAW